MGHRAWTKLTDEHDAIVRSSLEHHRGREVKKVGDGFPVAFDSAIRRVRAAREDRPVGQLPWTCGAGWRLYRRS